MGLFPRRARNKKFLLVGMNYFTKWVEAVPLANIADSNVKNFLWKNIVTQFGIPKVMVSDNGTKFKCQKIEEFCREYIIQ